MIAVLYTINYEPSIKKSASVSEYYISSSSNNFTGKRLQLNELHKIEDKIANSNDLMCLEDLFETVKEVETNLDQVGLTIKVTDQSCFAIEPLKFQIISL